MEEGRCPACGKVTGSRVGYLCSECSTGGYCLSGPMQVTRYPADVADADDALTVGNREPPEQSQKEDHTRSREGDRQPRVPKRQSRKLSPKEERTPPTEAKKLPRAPKRQPRKLSQGKQYTVSMVAGAAGRAIAAVGADDLPLEGQIEALEMARRWLTELENGRGVASS